MMFEPKKKVITIGGIKVPVDPDFRIMCEYGAAAESKDTEALRSIAERFYFAGLPHGVDGKMAADGMAEFYADGIAPDRDREDKKPSHKEPKKCFDFEEDEAYFYAAFLSEYGIDLEKVKLHWFTFCALFRGLPDECKLKRIIGIRAEELGDIKSGAEKARVRKLKGVFALKKNRPKRFKNAAERDAAMKAEYAARLRQVEEMMKNGS